MTHKLDRLPEILARHPQEPSSLIMVLQDIQQEYHYLPCEALLETARVLGVKLAKVFSVATFYNAFGLTPKGEKVVRICVGTACHIRGGALIKDQIEHQLGIQAGQTTGDGKFSIEVVACVGACAMAPVVIVDGKYHGEVSVGNVTRLVKG